MLRSESYMPGMQRRPSEASVWPCGHTQVNLGECLLICGAGRHMKEQPPFSIFSLHQLVPVLRRQQNLFNIKSELKDFKASSKLLQTREAFVSHRISKALKDNQKQNKQPFVAVLDKFRTHQTAVLAHGTQ